MRNIIALFMALMLTTANTAIIFAKPQRSKAPKKQIQRASKSRGEQNKKKPSKNIGKKSKREPKVNAEIKTWEQKKAAMTPLQLKELVEENHRLKMQNRKLDMNVQELWVKLKESAKEISTKEANMLQLAELKKELDALRKRVAIDTGSAPVDPEDLPADSYSVDPSTGQVFINGVLDSRYGVDQKTGRPFLKGIIFKVQIVASKNLDLSDVLVDDISHKSLEQEKVDGINKYTIGRFSNYWKADKLKEVMTTVINQQKAVGTK